MNLCLLDSITYLLKSIDNDKYMPNTVIDKYCTNKIYNVKQSIKPDIDSENYMVTFNK